MTSLFPWPACHLNWTQHSTGISKEKNNLRAQCSITVSCHWADKPVEIWNAPCALLVLQANGKAEKGLTPSSPTYLPWELGRLESGILKPFGFVDFGGAGGVVVNVDTSIVITFLAVFVLGDRNVNKVLLYKLTTGEVILRNQSFENWFILVLWCVIRQLNTHVSEIA